MLAMKSATSRDYRSVPEWCRRHPGGKVILGVDTLADAASVASAVPRAWSGTACIVFADEENNGMPPGMTKHFAVARIKFAFARHRCTWRVIR